MRQPRVRFCGKAKLKAEIPEARMVGNAMAFLKIKEENIGIAAIESFVLRELDEVQIRLISGRTIKISAEDGGKKLGEYLEELTFEP